LTPPAAPGASPAAPSLLRALAAGTGAATGGADPSATCGPAALVGGGVHAATGAGPPTAGVGTPDAGGAPPLASARAASRARCSAMRARCCAKRSRAAPVADMALGAAGACPLPVLIPAGPRGALSVRVEQDARGTAVLHQLHIVSTALSTACNCQQKNAPQLCL